MSQQEFYETVQREEEFVETKLSALAKMREPFPAHQISKLPKETKQQKEAREQNRSLGISCKVCGGWHHKDTIHLDYVGHAALTDRLLDVDPMWFWEPVSYGDDGLPKFDNTGGLWIRLHICGHSRLGYGHAASATFKDIGSREKEVIGDALRNAAMRFGAALDLWHKGDLHIDEEDKTPKPAEKKPMQIPANVAGQDYFDKCDEQERALILDFAMEIEGAETDQATFDAYTKAKQTLDTEQQAALWSKVSSQKRTAIKKIGQAKNAEKNTWTDVAQCGGKDSGSK